MADEPEETSDYAVERFDPADGGPIMAYEHVHRYAACAEIVRGKRVLDVASGEGYGAALLARTAQHVLGVDVDGDGRASRLPRSTEPTGSSSGRPTCSSCRSTTTRSTS